MEIRTLTLDDFDAVDALWRRTDGVGPVPRDEVARLLDASPELPLVAELDGAVVGAVLGTDDGRRGWIFRLAVDETARGRGIGRALVDEAERRLAARGVRHVRLLVLRENTTGLSFWEHAGYAGYDGVVLFGKTLGASAEDSAADLAPPEPADRC